LGQFLLSNAPPQITPVEKMQQSILARVVKTAGSNAA
jgi:hypothetical protein